MPLPTAATLRDASPVDFDELGFDSDVKLQALVDQAIGIVYRYTGARYNGVVFSGGPTGSDAVLIEPLFQQAVRTVTEMYAFRAQPEIAETLADFDLISSFSAGSYSETRRQPEKAGDALLLALHNVLWPLMDEDHQDDWLQIFTGVNPPAFAVTEVDWSANGSYMGYGAAGRSLLGGLPQDIYPLSD